MQITTLQQALPFYSDLKFQYESYDHKKAIEKHRKDARNSWDKNPNCFGISDELKKEFRVYRIGRIHQISCRKHGLIYKIGNKFPKTFYESELGIVAKPLFRPLSSLTKTIKIEGYNNGEPFVPMEEIEVEGLRININSIGLIAHQESGYEAFYLMDVYINVFKNLLQWHFNVFNLPPELWVEINEEQICAK